MASNGTNGTNGHTGGTANGHHEASISNGNCKVAVSNGDETVIKLSDRLAVHRSPKDFGSYAYSLVSLPAGSLFSPIQGITSGVKAYSSVQTGRDSHIELNSDLLYCNQSCDPSLEFDMSCLQVRVARGRDLKQGDALTFWYPSTEWDMAQPFKCECDSARCKGYINGAGQMDEQLVREYWLNAHIEQLLAERAAAKQTNNGAQSNGNGTLK